MYKKYIKRKFTNNLILAATDFLLEIIIIKNQIKYIDNKNIKRILLCNSAHMGDVIISTSIIREIKKKYPNSEIGFLIGSWSRNILKNHSEVQYIHILDHWMLNRGGDNILIKIINYFKQKKYVIQEIKSKNYDLAIDLYTCFPNFIPVIYAAKIKRRVGYISSGFGAMLTDGFYFPKKIMHESKYQCNLLSSIGISEAILNTKTPLNPGIKRVIKGRYVILHIGTGARAREWPIKNWVELGAYLYALGFEVVLTGSGDRDVYLCDQLKEKLTIAQNFCGRLDWDEYLSMLKYSEFIICLESMAAHMGDAIGVRTLALYSGMTDSRRWRPVGNSCKIIENKLSCSPCGLSKGCGENKCISGIEVSNVIDALRMNYYL
jgi:heptosyltransferase-2